jgi:hypothetical protein
MDQLLTRKTERASGSVISAQGHALHSGAKRLGDFNLKPLGAMLLAACFLSACGGGGSDSTPSPTSSGATGSNTGGTNGGSNGGTNGGDTGGTTTAPMTMSCPEGDGYQCSGGDIIKVDNGIALTRSGVEIYGKATSDLTNPPSASAFGFMAAQGANDKGVAEIRIKKDADGVISSPAVILKNLGLSWDGTTERPTIIETFNTTQGRTVMKADGTLSNETAFPTFDFSLATHTGTQANYANNRYFPRTDPSVCPAGTVGPCPTTETDGIRNLTAAQSGSDWRTGGIRPDVAEARRLHEDGDVHAGDSGGVPYPGSKGYRDFSNLAYQYVNLGSWLTQDTVQTVEWADMGGDMEHNTNRRGMVAFGDVTDPTKVPSTGSATYSGLVQGWYSATPNVDPTVFRGDATLTVNFATRQVTITVANTKTYDTAQTTVPATFTATTTMGAAGSNTANYLTGTVDNGTLKGGISGRYFGDVVTAGSSGAGPAESGGTFSLSSTASGATVMGGFIARKQ